MKHTFSAIALAISVGLPASASRATDSVSDADRGFIAMVSQGGMFEVKAGELAADQGSTQDIKDQGSTEARRSPTGR